MKFVHCFAAVFSCANTPVRRASRMVLLLLLLAALLAGFQPQDAQAQNQRVEHVVHISIDALGGKYLAQFLEQSPEEFKNFSRLIEEGASTLNARTDYSHTITLPNHTSMITGRPVQTPEGFERARGHYWQNNSTPGKEEALHDKNPDGGYTSSTFDVVHENGMTTALYSTKAKFIIYAQTYSESKGAPGAHGRSKIDHFLTGGKMHEEAMEQLRKYKPNYTFLHYGQPDSAGHGHGYLGDEYRDAVKLVDGFLGDLFDIVTNDAGWKGRTAIILSADHGGQPKTQGHGNAAHPYNYTLPFLVWGAGVAQGVDLYSINRKTRTNPAQDRVQYGLVDQPIRNGDGGNLALDLLGLPSIPGSFINRKQDLNVRDLPY